MNRFLHELTRRNVHRVAFVYLAGGWLILQLADVLGEIYGLEGSSLRWLVALLVIGFVPALALSWVFELTPQGLRREADLQREAAAPSLRSHRADRILIVLLALAVLAFDRFVLFPEEAAQTEPSAPTIAVLPFIDLSAEGDQDHFASGIAEEMLNLLTRVEGLRVAVRCSTFRTTWRNRWPRRWSSRS